MRVKLLFDEEKPKVPVDEMKAAVRKAGLDLVTRHEDICVVVGGDGIFSRFGRSESKPLLFVGVKSRSATGSKAYLAGAYFDELPSALAEVAAGRYTVREHPRLRVLRNGGLLGEVFTDVYLQRGAESNCIRYKVKVSGAGVSIEEAAIGDGVVVTTAAGSTGYYSYPDKIHGVTVESPGHAALGLGEVGICHIVPTFIERSGSEGHQLRYAVPWVSTVELCITRRADARLYGATGDRGGVKITPRDRLAIVPAGDGTKVISVP